MDRAELLALADRHRAARPPCRIRCCMAAGCQSANGEGVKQALAKAVQGAGLSKEIEVQDVGCLRWCGAGPLVQFDPSGAMYRNVRPEDAPALVATVKGDGEGGPARVDLQHPFFTRQLPIVLENSGQIDPERLEEYLTADGYQALYHALFEMNPADVVAAVTRSGLRGRGGAGYPTGLKWATVAKNPGKTKYVICNGDEGDPGAFMDRSVLESDPHRVLEGMAIAAYAIGASEGYLYVRAEYPLAIRRLTTAIRQARQHNLLGEQILGTPFSLNLEIRLGAGAFVCGEETALIASIEGLRGAPRPRPPYPAESGLWGCPTLINNVETFANVAPIISHGSAWFAGIGTEKSKGTKVFALTGRVNNTGLIALPTGIPLREIVEEIGGGVPDGRAL